MAGRRPGSVVAALALLCVVAAGWPASQRGLAAGSDALDMQVPAAIARTTRLTLALAQEGTALRAAVAHGLSGPSVYPMAPPSRSFDVTSTQTVMTATTIVTSTAVTTSTGVQSPTSTAQASLAATGTATATATALVPAAPTVTASATPQPTITATAAVRRRATSTPRPRPRPTRTATPTPRPTRTPLPTATPTPRVLKVTLLSVGIYTTKNGHQRRVSTVALGQMVRLKINVRVSNAPATGVAVNATWRLQGLDRGKPLLEYGQAFTIKSGLTGLFYDLVVPTRNFANGGYYFSGSIAYQGRLQRLETGTTLFHVNGEIALPAQRVHYAHLKIDVPAGWILDFQRRSNGNPTTGRDSLIMFSPSRRAALSVVSVELSRVPSVSDLRAFPALILEREFGTVTDSKRLNVKSAIDGHDVFAAQGTVQIAGRASRVVALVTNKNRQFYAFSVIDIYNLASRTEINDGFSTVFSSTLD